ncbi:MAG TPA: thiolase family protein [Desulfomonilaceae bacterium]|nr:thiolase family protein [Desulfomonilaceae bacterium]
MAGKYVIVGAKRTPFGKYLGSLSEMEPLDLAVHAGRAALTAQGPDLSPNIEQVFVGNCIPGSFEAGSVTGRQICLKLGMDTFAVTVDTACCSPLTALRMALWGLRLGEYSSALVVGVESMSRVPHTSRDLRTGVRIGEVKLKDFIFPISYPGYNSVAVDASDGAAKYEVPKRMLDTWAMGSHYKWARAQSEGKFADELAAISVSKGRERFLFAMDESPRPDGNVSAIEQLPTVFGARTTTAGNAPGLNDGASAVVVMTEEKARELGLQPLGTIVDMAGETDMPFGISWIPAHTIKKVLNRTNLSLDQMDLIEINEAFAAMPLVSTKILADHDQPKWYELMAKTNVNGGAIAMGHPVGASGLRIMMTMMYELRRRGGGLGVAAICGGLTQGEAVVVHV